jgi:hypothetical protein
MKNKRLECETVYTLCVGEKVEKCIIRAGPAVANLRYRGSTIVEGYTFDAILRYYT